MYIYQDLDNGLHSWNAVENVETLLRIWGKNIKHTGHWM